MHLSSNAISIELNSTNKSLLEKTSVLLSSSYSFEETENKNAILRVKISFLEESELKKLRNKSSNLPISTTHEMFWSSKTNEAFIAESLLINPPINFFIPAVCLAANLNNISFFHASCCANENNILFFLGASTSGKSSFAYMLYENGYKMAGDDLIFIKKDKLSFQIFSLPKIVKFRSETLSKNKKEQSLEKLKLHILEYDSPKIFIFFPIFNINSENPVIKEITKIDAAAMNLKNNLNLSRNKSQITKELEKAIIKNTACLINDSSSCHTINYNDKIFCDLLEASKLIESFTTSLQ